jgi:hypothetical protein
MEEVLDHPRWGTHFAMAYGPVARQTAQKHLRQENRVDYTVIIHGVIC